MTRRPTRAELLDVMVSRCGYDPRPAAPPARFAEGPDAELYKVRYFAFRSVAALKAAGQTAEGYIRTFIDLRARRGGKLTATEYGVPG